MIVQCDRQTLKPFGHRLLVLDNQQTINWSWPSSKWKKKQQIFAFLRKRVSQPVDRVQNQISKIMSDHHVTSHIFSCSSYFSILFVSVDRPTCFLVFNNRKNWLRVKNNRIKPIWLKFGLLAYTKIGFGCICAKKVVAVNVCQTYSMMMIFFF